MKRSIGIPLASLRLPKRAPSQLLYLNGLPEHGSKATKSSITADIANYAPV